MVILGIDLGGTQIRVGVIIRDELKKVSSIPTPNLRSKDDLLEAIAGLVEQFIQYKFESIGIGVPSVVDIERGIVYNVTNIPSWKEVHLKDFMEARFNVPVHVNNDANCFAAGERYFGKGRHVKSLAGVTLGTGLGTGLIFNNHLYEGKNCGAGELCNLPYLEHNYEYYCSGQFFKDELKILAHEAFQHAEAGDKKALSMFDKFGHHLGKFMQAVLYAYDPEMVVIGGSVTSAFPYFQKSMHRAMEEGFIFPNSLKNLKIEISEMEHVAIYGAASLVIEKEEK